MATGSLGCMYPYFFYGCRWEEAWARFGNRIHRADFKCLAAIGPPITLKSVETRARIGLRYAFCFHLSGEPLATAARTSAIRTLITSAVADHDRPAIHAGGSVGLIHKATDDIRSRRRRYRVRRCATGSSRDCTCRL